MDHSNSSYHNEHLPKKQIPEALTSPSNSIAVYTVLCLLIRMKGELGLEAMIEYLAHYVRTIEEHNPQLKKAVHEALSLMDVQRLYDEAIRK